MLFRSIVGSDVTTGKPDITRTYYMSHGDHDMDGTVFAAQEVSTVAPDAVDAEGFGGFISNYVRGLAVERAAVENLR